MIGDEDGATIVEYGLLVALIAMVALVVVTTQPQIALLGRRRFGLS